MTIINAAKILTADGWLTNQSLVINDLGMIENICDISVETLSNCDFQAELILPGFINCHSHAFQWSMAGLAENFGCENDSFWSWRELMYSFLQKITPEDVGIISEALYIDMLKAGYTEVGEFHYLHNDFSGQCYEQLELLSLQVIEAAKSAGIALCHMPVLYQHSGFGKQPLTDLQQRFFLSEDNYQQLFSSLSARYANEPLVSLGVAPHSLRAVDLEQLQQLIDFCPKQSPIHIHIAEQLAEVEQSLSHHQKTPVEWLFDNFQVDQQWCLVHATHLTPKEIKQIANSGACVGLCPTTEANLGDGLFPLMDYKRQSGFWGIGSDSHVMINSAEELRLLEYGQRLQSHSRAIYSNQQQPLTATNLVVDGNLGGSRALKSKAGTIKTGSRADLISLEIPDEFQHFSAEQLLSKWLFSSRNNWIKEVMVSGRWVVSNGLHEKQESAKKNLKIVLKKLFNNS